MRLPDATTGDKKKLVRALQDIVDRCNASRSERGSMCRTLKQWRYAGSEDRTGSMYNRINAQSDRLASYLFAPGDLRFHLEPEGEYGKEFYTMMDVGGRYLSNQIEAADLDLMFASGVDQACLYGSAIMKIMWSPRHGIRGRFVPMYNFGVWREDENKLDAQEAMVETTYITRFDLWRALSAHTDREKLYKRAMASASKKTNMSEAESYFHSVLIASQGLPVQTTGSTVGRTAVGGIVDLTTTPVGLSKDPVVADDLIPLYEITVWDDDMNDYTTCQFVYPDLVLEPYLKKKNLYVPGENPYIHIQTLEVPNYFWGRSEILDIINLQNQLSERMLDMSKLSSVQYDRFLAFLGQSAPVDEAYSAARDAGFIAMGQGEDVKDLTPPFPDHAFEEIKLIRDAMDDVTGFGPILSGQGEQGVRAGTHAQTLLKTASPRLRKRSLNVERQCAEMGQKVFELVRHKDPKLHWTIDGSEFVMSLLPEDIRVTVDSHSSSPIYEEDHKELAMFLEKSGSIDGEDVLDMVNVPRRELLKSRYKERKAAEQAFLEKHPELALEKAKKKH